MDCEVHDQKLNADTIGTLSQTWDSLAIMVPVLCAPLAMVESEEYVLNSTGTHYRLTIGWWTIEWLGFGDSKLTIARKHRREEIRLVFVNEVRLWELRDLLLEKKLIRVVTYEEFNYCISSMKQSDIMQDVLLAGEDFPNFYINISKHVDGGASEERRILKVIRWIRSEHKKIVQESHMDVD